MKKILVINTKYKIFGGEDSNIKDELSFLKKYYIVNYLEFNNSERLSFSDLFGFLFGSNPKSNNILKQKIDSFNPDVAYVHNTWFKANLGIFKILNKAGIKTLLKIHNFRFNCTKTFSFKKHLENNNICPGCGMKANSFKYFNKYFEDSVLKSLFVNLYGKKYIDILKKNNLKILVLNIFYRDFMQSLGISTKNIEIVNNPISIDNSNVYNSKSDYVVYAGSLSDQKGTEELIESWKNSDLKLKLLMIGTSNLSYYSRKYNQISNVEFINKLENEKVLDYIKDARAVITATKMYEGQPKLLCEASGLGVPSIYPSFGGMDEYFPNNYPLSFEQYNYIDLEKKNIRINKF